ncbi:MAG: hypothetical protein LR015_01835 [Verrucomicrobia bacterium]|nr:hypothetical protein [Verrucomicrobiota bacterium]
MPAHSFRTPSSQVITSVTLPTSITNIEPLAFVGLDDAFIFFTGPAPVIDEESFSGVDNPIIRAPADQPGYDAPEWQDVPIVLGGFDFWRFENGFNLQSDLANTILADSGVSLLQAYAFNLDLSTSLQAQIPTAQLTAGQLQINFFADRSDVSYVIEFSTNLTNWTPLVPTAPDVNGISSNTLPLSNGKGFIRIGLTLTPPN